jgi:hypothetical protein
MREEWQDRYELIQRLNKANVTDIDKIQKKSFGVGVLVFVLGFAFGWFLMSTFNHPIEFIEHSELKPEVNTCMTSKCHTRKWAMIRYFESRKNPHPVESATAVLATTKPKLIAAIITKGEKNTPYWKRNHGWKNRHNGMGGVNEKDWGKVPANPIDQAKQIDWVIDELLDQHKGSRKMAISHYGGDSTDNYWNQVSAEINKVP